jgi:hypothetical protein
MPETFHFICILHYYLCGEDEGEEQEDKEQEKYEQGEDKDEDYICIVLYYI